MKNATLLFLTLLFIVKSFSLRAQEEGTNKPYYWHYYSIYEINCSKDKNKQQRLKQKTIVHPSSVEVCKYDTAGRVISYSPNWKREIRVGYAFDDKKSFLELYKKGKLMQRDSFDWEGKNLKELDHFDGNNKIASRQRYKYDSTYVMEYAYEKMKRGKFKERRKTVYEYYQDYSYKKVTYYKKGKPSYYTVFDCNPVGLNHKVNRDSSYNCVKYDIDSLGNKIKVTVTNGRSSSWKYIEYFNGKDEEIACKAFLIGKKEELCWVYYYVPGSFPLFSKFVSYGTLFSYVGYKEFYKIENKYDKENNCIETLTSKNSRLKSRNENIFNEKGLTTKTERYNRKNKKKSEINYTYEFY